MLAAKRIRAKTATPAHATLARVREHPDMRASGTSGRSPVEGLGAGRYFTRGVPAGASDAPWSSSASGSFSSSFRVHSATPDPAAPCFQHSYPWLIIAPSAGLERPNVARGISRLLAGCGGRSTVRSARGSPPPRSGPTRRRYLFHPPTWPFRRQSPAQVEPPLDDGVPRRVQRDRRPYATRLQAHAR